MPEQLYADIPGPLLWVDELLQAYGQWAARRSSAARCGSAERMYRSRNREAERAPLQAKPRDADMLTVQRALASVPHLARDVLIGLYIPGKSTTLRGIPPQLRRARHLAGLYALAELLRAATLRADARRVAVPASRLAGAGMD